MMNTQAGIKTLLPKTDLNKGIQLVIRLVLGGTFLVSGVLKLMDPEGFAQVVDAFGILPSGLCFMFGICLSLLEVGAGIGTILGWTSCYILISIMLAGFIVVLGYAIGMGYDIDCGCFGPEDPESKAFAGLRFSLFRDLVLLGANLFLLIKTKKIP